MTSARSPEETRRIEAEILAALDRLVDGCERLDMDLAFGIFSRGPDFRMIAADGSLCDFATYYDNNVAYLDDCSAFSLTTLRTDVLVLRMDAAVLSWIYRAEVTLESGAFDVIDRAGATFVFEKRDGEWKVVRYHESSLPAVRHDSPAG